MGIMEGCLAIGRGTAAAMAIVLAQLARGVNLAILERLKEIKRLFIHSTVPARMVSLYADERT